VGLTESVDSTWTGIAGKDYHGRWTWFRSGADAIGIAHKTFGTVAHRTVGHHTTESRETTAAGAGINALVIPACFVRRTIGAIHALRTTEGWGAMVLGQAGATSSTRRGLALGVGAAGRRLTGIHFVAFYRGYN